MESIWRSGRKAGPIGEEDEGKDCYWRRQVCLREAELNEAFESREFTRDTEVNQGSR